LSPTLRCAACGARWHTAARRGRTAAADTCLRCGGPLSEEIERPAVPEAAQVSMIEELIEAAHSGDLERALGMCHPAIEITEVEALVPGHDGRFEGLSGARRWMEVVCDVWDVEFRSEPRERRLLDDGSLEMVHGLEARSSRGHPDFSEVTRSLWQFESGKLRRVEFSVVGAAAEDAPRA